MAVNLRCPNLKCREILRVPDSARGTRVKCRFCRTVLLVPHPSQKPVPASPMPEDLDKTENEI